MDNIDIFEYIKNPAIVLHVLSVVLGMGSALVSDILFNFFSKDKKLDATEITTLSILKNIVFYSLIVIVISGGTIFLSDIEKYTSSSKFMAKMSILLILLVNGYVLNKYIWPRMLGEGFFTSVAERNTRRVAFACGAVSVISWIAVCTLGVLNRLAMSYQFIMLSYLGIILFGVIVALIIEKREMN